MRLLHLDSSILGTNSVSRQLSGAVVDRFVKETPELEVTYRDLTAQPLPHLSGAHLANAPEAQTEIAAGQAALEEFLAADIVVIGAPMYNFTIPTQLKAWIDRIVMVGKTVRYTATGPEGLVGNKRVIIAISRGGFYGAGTAGAALEHVETYLRTVFGFIGVTPEIIIAEGLQVAPEHREKAMRGAAQTITELSLAPQLSAAA